MVENRVRRQKGLFDLAVAVKATHDFALTLEDPSNNDTLQPKISNHQAGQRPANRIFIIFSENSGHISLEGSCNVIAVF
jgi:hypothetical protein